MLRKNLSTEGTDHRNLDGFKTDFFCCYARCFGAAKNFLVATQEILEEILIKNGRGPEINQLPMNQNL